MDASVNRLETALYDLSTSRRAAERFKENSGDFLQPYRLTAEEQELIEAADVGQMKSLGVNSMLLMGFWLIVKGRREMGEYMKRLTAAGGGSDE